MNLFPILIIRLLCIFVLTSCSYCPIFKTKIKVFFEIAKRLFYCSATLRLYMSLCLSLSHLLIQHSIVIYNFWDNFEKLKNCFVCSLSCCWGSVGSFHSFPVPPYTINKIGIEKPSQNML